MRKIAQVVKSTKQKSARKRHTFVFTYAQFKQIKLLHILQQYPP